MEILITVGISALLILLVSLMIHMLNTRHAQEAATHHYESFHPGAPHRDAEAAGPLHEAAGTWHRPAHLPSSARGRGRPRDEA